MTIYYSSTDRAFYNSAVHSAKQIPIDAVDITQSNYETLLDGQSAGKIISPDEDGRPILIDPAAPLVDYVALMASKRYEHEIAGISLNGMAIDTGRDSQGLITGAVVQAMLDPGYSLVWKTSTGFVRLTADQIIGVASAVRAHVQACFDRESELLEALSDNTLTEVMLEEGWPA